MHSRTISFLLIIFMLLELATGQTQTIDEAERIEDGLEPAPSNLQNRQCDEKLGMESGDITDDNLQVSASDLGFGKEQARLNGDSAWVTFAVPNQWIQVDLEKLMYVSGVQTQGKSILKFGYQLWVSAYKVLYKEYTTQSNWLAVSEGVGGGQMIFDGNTETSRTDTSLFQEPIQAKIVRIVPMQWNPEKRRIALRFELLGCNIEEKSGCGSPRILTNPTGFIASMNYPNKYDNNANCVWEITAPAGNIVALEFDDGFTLEAHCEFEYVQIFDIIGEEQRSLGRLCGKTQPGRFISTYNRLKVHFMTDHFQQYTGFRATYVFLNASGCGGPQILNDPSGTIQSVNYPENYDNNRDCLWDIFTDSDKLIEIHFNEMKLQQGSQENCVADNVQIINIGKGIAKGTKFKVEKYCGTTVPNNFISWSNKLRIIFHTDGRFNDKGFQATFKAVQASGCGGKRDLKETMGVIQSLNYPNKYTINLRCEWNIITTQDKDIKITFLNLDLEGHSDCQYDYVSIFDGTSQRHLLGKYCNKLIIQPLLAHSGAMKIIFVSDEYNTEKGFEASYVIIPRATSQETTRIERITMATTETHSFNEEVTNTTYFSQTTRKNYINTRSLLAWSKEASTSKKKIILKDTTAKKRNAEQPQQDDEPNIVTGEMAKWIIIGLISVSGLLIILVLLGVILCCRQTFSRSNTSMQGSIKKANSGVMQNHAYDFSIASTNHSIRSKQVELPESSQVSETVSHQDTLRRAPSCESHIYFSIDDYCNNTKKQNTPSTSTSKPPAEPGNVKVHFSKHQQSLSGHTNNGSDELASTTIHSEEEDYYDDEDDQNTLNEDSEIEGCSSDVFLCRTSQSSAKESGTSPVAKLTKDGKKLMVANILYESTDSVE